MFFFSLRTSLLFWKALEWNIFKISNDCIGRKKHSSASRKAPINRLLTSHPGNCPIDEQENVLGTIDQLRISLTRSFDMDLA
ncbi:hypothetical protein CEXT_648701 [Caerostris extrusa]|uniref:Uncharacterized protein n=1 Tax=Caerostris extrusa TaxID=172846 RepID=A0AAV4M8C7_CAEEX|nr:hypothetical protein CEXT_648701 [Caerostris extrusa]